MFSSEQMEYLVKVRDEATAHQKAIAEGFRGIQATAATAGQGVDALHRKLDSFVTWIRGGFLAALGSSIFGVLQRGIHELSSLLPEAVDAGREYAQTLKDIQRQTGMTATEVSEFAGVMGKIGIPLDQVQRTLAMFSVNVGEIEGPLQQLGIQVRDSSGAMLDAATIITNVRHAVNTYGESLTSTKAMQELFGRSGYKVAEFFQLTDADIKVMTEDLKRWGLVLGQDVLNAAERSNRALDSLGLGIKGLQTNIFAALEPTLTSFVNSFAAFLQQHLQQIVTFAVSAANFVMGVIGGILGISFEPLQAGLGDLGTRALMTKEQFADVYGFTDALNAASTSGVNKHVAAIDRQIAAIRAAAQARQDANRAEELSLNLQRAQMQLDDLRANSPFVAGLSNAEQQLALQKHQADIRDAAAAVEDAKSDLADYGLDQREKAEIDALERQKARYQQSTAAAKVHYDLDKAYDAYVERFKRQQADATAANAALNFNAINQAALEWRDKGVGFANDLRKAFGGVMDALFGSEHAMWEGGEGSGRMVMGRSGGLIGALGGVATAVGIFAGALVLGGIGGAVSLVAAIATAVTWVGRLAVALVSGAAGGLVSGAAGAVGWVARLGGALLGLNPVIAGVAVVAGEVALIIDKLGIFKPKFTSGTGNYLGSPTTKPSYLGSTSTTTSYSGTTSSTSGQPGGYAGKGGIDGLATGGLIPARPGGTLYRMAEAGEDEAAVPRSLWGMIGEMVAGAGGAGGGGVTELVSHIHLHLDGREIMKLVNRELYYQANRQPQPLIAG
jgi:hypothetical protein